MLDGSFELRQPLFTRFSGAVFLDYGNVWENSWSVDPLDLKYAIGVGLRYLTPVGPFRCDIARKINRQSIDEEYFQFHISIGQAF